MPTELECTKCKKKEKDPLICGMCNSGICSGCLELDAKSLKVLKASRNFVILCLRCKEEEIPKLQEIREVMDTINTLKQEVEGMKPKLEKIKLIERLNRDHEQRIKTLEEKSEESAVSREEHAVRLIEEKWLKLDEKVAEITTPDWPTLIESTGLGKVVQSQQSILDKITETEKRLRDDQREAERRKPNCIIHNVEESRDADNEERNRHDRIKIDEILHHSGADQDIKIINIFRIGQFGNQVLTKPRPLKLIFESEEKKLHVVRKYRLTKRSGTQQQKQALGRISIVPDRTLREREEYKILKIELEERTNNGEENLVINNWRVQEKPKRWGERR